MRVTFLQRAGIVPPGARESQVLWRIYRARPSHFGGRLRARAAHVRAHVAPSAATLTDSARPASPAPASADSIARATLSAVSARATASIEGPAPLSAHPNAPAFWAEAITSSIHGKSRRRY